MQSKSLDKPLSRLLSKLKLAVLSIKAFGKLLLYGHLYEEVQGEQFNLRTTLTFTGDWQNFIYYKGDESLDINDLNELLASEEELIDEAKLLSAKIASYLQAITYLPGLFALLIAGGVIYYFNSAIPNEIVELVSTHDFNVFGEEWQKVASVSTAAIVGLLRKRLMNYLLLCFHYLRKLTLGFINLFR